MDPLSSAFLTPLITKLADAVTSGASSLASDKIEEIKATLKIGFRSYAERQVNRYLHMKTIITSTAPIKFSEMYVNLNLFVDGRFVSDDSLISEFESKKRFLITATAGAGKSMLMRYMYFSFLLTQDGYFPMMFDLRDLNHDRELNLVQAIYDKISEYLPGFSKKQLTHLMEVGHIALFLDGFDEIFHDEQNRRGKEITSLASRYPKCLIAVTSRPDEHIVTWESFFNCHIMDLDEDQVRTLVRKIPYDSEVKAIFIRKLEEGLYETHGEFLVNPLLVIMMLVTLEQFAEVPAKIHLFYEYAFEALFARHDATKAGFQRKRYVTLALDDYRRLFSYFCAITYLKQQFKFTETSILTFMSEAINASQIHTVKTDMLSDLSHCTCMIVRDGLEFTFSHRSFQEYFAANFFSRIRPDAFVKYSHKIAERSTNDNVLLMMSEMNKELFEESWALPKLTEMIDRVAGINAASNPVKFGIELLGPLKCTVGDREKIGISVETASELSAARYALYSIYGVFDEITDATKREIDNDRAFIEDIVEGRAAIGDERWNFLRDSRSKDRRVEGFTFEERDNEWLIGTTSGAFIKYEYQALTRLHAELRERVLLRKEGMDRAFDL